MSIKRTIITAIVAMTLVAVVAPVAASATTVADLMAQIAALQSQLQGLSGTTTTSTATGACAGVTFSRNLTVGSTGTDVKCLQQTLNVSPTSGFFGPLTLAAVKAFQVQKGLTPANQVGPMTRALLNTALTATTTTTTTTPTTGTTPATGVAAEGSFTATIAPFPSDNANVTTTSNVPVYGINVKATGSNMKIDRVDLKLVATKTADGSIVNPANLVTGISAYDGSTLLQNYTIGASDILKSGSDYYVRLSGINFNVSKDETRTLTFTANLVGGLESNRALAVSVYGDNGIRGTDTLGLNSYDNLTDVRTQTITYASVNSSTLTMAANVSPVISSSVKVDTTNGTQDVLMTIFNLKSTVGASKVTKVAVTASGTGIAKIAAVKLYDGSTLLGSVVPVSNVATFSDLSIMISKDQTKVLTAKADFNAGVTNGQTARLSVANLTDISYDKPDLSSATTVAGSAVTGNYMYLFDGKAAVLTLSSPLTASYSYNSTTPSASSASGTITFRMKADGGTVTKPTASDIVVYQCNSSTCTSATGVTVDVQVSPNTNLADGSEAIVTVNASKTRDTGVGAGFTYFKIYSVTWVVDGGTPVAQTWGFDDYRTPSVNAY